MTFIEVPTRLGLQAAEPQGHESNFWDSNFWGCLGFGEVANRWVVLKRDSNNIYIYININKYISIYIRDF